MYDNIDFKLSQDDINVTETASRISKQYVYSSGKYVYTENGFVTAIQK